MVSSNPDPPRPRGLGILIPVTCIMDKQPDSTGRPAGEVGKHFDDEELMSLIRGAEVVLGVDARTGKTLGVFKGVEKVKRIATDLVEGRMTQEQSNVLRVPLNRQTDDLEVLDKMVQTVTERP